MSDYLRQKIDQTRTLLEAKLQDVAALRGQLQAYEDALRHSVPPGATAANAAPVAAVNELRPQGPSPNAYWANLIADLALQGDRFTINDVVRELTRLGKTLERKSVRAKLTEFVKQGMVIRIQEGVFKA